MGRDQIIKRLRAATEDDVSRAYERAFVERPDVPTIELIEFFNRMVDVLIGEEET